MEYVDKSFSELATFHYKLHHGGCIPYLCLSVGFLSVGLLRKFVDEIFGMIAAVAEMGNSQLLR